MCLYAQNELNLSVLLSALILVLNLFRSLNSNKMIKLYLQMTFLSPKATGIILYATTHIHRNAPFCPVESPSQIKNPKGASPI